MGSGRKPGWICVFDDTAEDIDPGTNCLACSPTPGSVGLEADVAEARQADLALKVRDDRLDEEKSDTAIFMSVSIEEISRSPPGRTKEGQSIVALLRALNKDRKILYADTGSARGDWDGTWIRVNERYRNRIGPTMVELFHEGTHALWRARHPIRKGKTVDREADVRDEIHAQRNQLLMFAFVKKAWTCMDAELERRQERLDLGAKEFEAYVRESFGSGALN